MKVTLRPFQLQAVKDIRDSYSKGYRAPLLVLPTGAGKTVVFCDIAERVIAKGNRVIILVHRDTLLKQASRHLEKLGVPHGLIAAGHSMTGDPVQIASVMTLANRLDQIKHPPELIISDEAHHDTSKTRRKVLEQWRGHSRLLGVTATPERLDGSGLGLKSGGHYDTMIEGPQIKDLIDQGFLSLPVHFAPDVGADLKNIPIQAGDFASKEMANRMDKPVITGCAIEHYKKICCGVPMLTFCATIKHAMNVANQFNESGIPASFIDGSLSDSIINYRISALADGQIMVLTSCELINEGTDIPIVGAIQMLRRTRSLNRYLQMGGRGLRLYPGKTATFILDHVNNCYNPGFGFLDDHRTWTLEGKKRKKKSDDEENIKILRCPKCFRTVRFGVSVCPDCGTQIVPLGAGNNRDIKQVDGNLIQVTKLDIERIKTQRRREVGMANSLEELLRIADERGYKRQWAYMAWNRRKMRHHSTPKHLQESMAL